MSYQLEKQVAQRLKDFFEPFDFIDKVVIFGSRAKHNANPKSDIDLCIYSLEMSDAQFSKLKLALDELPILYKIDVVHFEKSNEALRENVSRDGKLLFVKTLEFDKFFKTKTSKSYQIETKDYLESATYPVVDQGQKFIVAYSDNEDKLYRIEEPVIIFGDHTRIIKYIDFDFIIGADGTKILLPFDDTIDAKYAYYQLLFTKIESLGYSRHFKVLKEKIFYKPSLTKQKEIAQTLDKASELIALRKATIEKLDELSQSIFIDMFGDSIENPMKWNSVKFGKMISVLTDYHANGSYKVLKKHVELLDQKNYALMVRTTDLEKNNFEDGVKYITKEAYDFLNKTKVFGNELIMNKIGSAGNIYLMPKLNVPVSLGMNQFLIRLNESCNSIFVFKLLKSEYGKKNIEKQVRGAVTKSITKDAVRDIDLLLPPLNLQNQFAQTIEKIESQKSLYEAELTKLQEGFDALMAQSFEG